jgi:hypothetical protein
VILGDDHPAITDLLDRIGPEIDGAFSQMKSPAKKAGLSFRSQCEGTRPADDQYLATTGDRLNRLK